MASKVLKDKQQAPKPIRINQREFRRKQLFFYVLPGLIFIFLMCYLPMWGWLYAFVRYRTGLSLFDCEFVGLRNFKLVFGNPAIRKQLFQSVKNTLGMNFLGYLTMPLPMIFAVFLNEVKSPKFRKVVQTVSTLPHFISWVILYSLVHGLLSNAGVINSLLMEYGIISAPINILATDKHVWIIQTVLKLWKGIGWSSIIYFAALAGIDQNMYEAAMIDGAGRLQRIWHITVPNLMPTFFVLLILEIGAMLDTGIDQYFVFSNAMNKEFIQTLDLYVYNLGIGTGNISAGVAMGILKTVIALSLFASANWLSKKVRGYGIA